MAATYDGAALTKSISAILGVEPDAQGQGLGSQVLRPMLDRCDSEGVPAYLESSKATNVPFYERHGFRNIEESARSLELVRVRLPPEWRDSPEKLSALPIEVHDAGGDGAVW